MRLGLLSPLVCAFVLWGTAPATEPGRTPRVVEVPPIADAELAPELQDAATRVAREMENSGGRWDHAAILRVREAVRGQRSRNALLVFRAAEIETASAERLARVFTVSDELFEFRKGQTLLVFTFEKSGAADWELTPLARRNLMLFFHPIVPEKLERRRPSVVRGKYERCDALGDHLFDSGLTAPGLRCTLAFREHHFVLTTSADLSRDDWSFADRLDAALTIIPPAHLALVHEIVLDPGDHPPMGRFSKINATTSGDGKRVSLFLAGAGKDVPQDRLDQTTAHEFGHVVASHEGDDFWEDWRLAVQRDGLGVSEYGLTNLHEDFAESYLLYLGGGARNEIVRPRHPARFAILERLFARP